MKSSGSNTNLPDTTRNIIIKLIDEKNSKIKEIETPKSDKKLQNFTEKHNDKKEIED